MVQIERNDVKLSKPMAHFARGGAQTTVANIVMNSRHFRVMLTTPTRAGCKQHLWRANGGARVAWFAPLHKGPEVLSFLFRIWGLLNLMGFTGQGSIR